MTLTPAEKQKAYRDRNAAGLPQMSRAEGVPRFPLKVWKRAAEVLIAGPDTTPSERRNGKPSKVMVLRSLCAADKEWRRKMSEFVRQDNARVCREHAVKMGWISPDGSPVVETAATEEPRFPSDPTWAGLVYRMMRCGQHGINTGQIPPIPRAPNGRIEDGAYAEWTEKDFHPFVAKFFPEVYAEESR